MLEILKWAWDKFEGSRSREVVQLPEPGHDPDAVLVVQNDQRVVDLRPFVDGQRTRPARMRGTSEHREVGSFIDHVQRHGQINHTAIFVDKASAEAVAVLNYAGFTLGAFEAGHGDYRAVCAFPVSPEWRFWTRLSRPMDQAEFASVLEGRILDVLDPASALPSTVELLGRLGVALASPSELLEVSRGLAIRAEVTVAQAVRLSSGETQVTFSEEHRRTDGRGPLAVPAAFLLGLRVFEGGPLYQVPVRLRYKLREGTISWTVELVRADRVQEDAFAEATARIKSETGVPVFYGRPEEPTKPGPYPYKERAER